MNIILSKLVYIELKQSINKKLKFFLIEIYHYFNTYKDVVCYDRSDYAYSVTENSGTKAHSTAKRQYH